MKELFGSKRKKVPLNERERELLREVCIEKVEERKHFIEQSIKAQRLKHEKKKKEGKKERKKDKKQNKAQQN